MSRRGFNSQYSRSEESSGVYRAEVKAVGVDNISVIVPRLFPGVTIQNVPFYGSTPVIGEDIYVLMLEGRATDLLAICDVDIFEGELTGPVKVNVKNTSGGPLSKGDPVYVTGSVGASEAIEVGASNASTAASMPTLGLLESGLADDEVGEATILGTLEGVDTSTFAVNDEVYVAPGGGLTVTKPTAVTDEIQRVGRVVRVDASTGEILVQGAGRTNDVPNLVVATDLELSGTAEIASTVLVGGTAWTQPTYGDVQVGFANLGTVGTMGSFRLGLHWNWDRGADSGYYALGNNSYLSANSVQLGNDGVRFEHDDVYGATTAPTLRARVDESGLFVLGGGVDGGLKFGDGIFTGYEGIATANMTAESEYLLISTGTTTLLSTGSGGDLYLRAGGNSATDQIRISGSTTSVFYHTTTEHQFLVNGVEKGSWNSTGLILGTGDDGLTAISAGSVSSTGYYGSVQTIGSGGGGWEGFSISGRVTFMHDGANAWGIYNDVLAENHWFIYGTKGAGIDLRYNGSTKLSTLSNGVGVTGDVYSSTGRYYNAVGSDDWLEFETTYARLYIAGTERFRVTSAGDIYSSGDYHAFNSVSSVDDSIRQTGNNFQFRMNGTDYMHLHTTDTELRGSLHINSDSLTTVASRGFSCSTAEAHEFFREVGNDTTQTNGILALYAYLNVSTSTKTLKHAFYSNGTTGNEDNSYGALGSDRRIKDRIRPIASLFDPIAALESFEPRVFDVTHTIEQADEEDDDSWFLQTRADAKIDAIGYVAQESPEWFQSEVGGGYLTTRDSKLVPVLHAGWLHHHDRITELEARLEAAGL